jgi:hypothetical protein
MTLALVNINACKVKTQTQREKFDRDKKYLSDVYMLCRFRLVSSKVFASWKSQPLLQTKKQIILDVEKAYNGKLWGTCMPSILPLIDYLMREYFQTNNLTTSMGVLWQAFEIANFIPKDTSDLTSGLKPILGTWEIEGKQSNLKKVSDNPEKDLRLPGVYLTSLVDFARRYYAFHHIASNTTEINRHAILHGDMNYCSRVQTTKSVYVFRFVDSARTGAANRYWRLSQRS